MKGALRTISWERQLNKSYSEDGAEFMLNASLPRQTFESCTFERWKSSSKIPHPLVKVKSFLLLKGIGISSEALVVSS